jgi:DNA polymerase III subunit chi
MQVDFYQLSRDPVEQVVPAIARRVLGQGERLLVVDGRADALDQLSRSLWNEPESFLAHGRTSGDNADLHPILLSEQCAPENGAHYIALTDGLWRDEALGFARAFYFFDAATIDTARSCWKMLSGKVDVTARFWRQDGRRWVQGP